MELLTLEKAQTIINVVFILVTLFLIVYAIGVSVIWNDRTIKKYDVNEHNTFTLRNILTHGLVGIVTLAIYGCILSVLCIIALSFAKVYF